MTEAAGTPDRRVLGIRDLIVYGIVLIQPIAPVGIFGIAGKISHGHVVAAILVAMIAMAFTAASYGHMAGRYPSAGSAYTYVGRTFGAVPGFLVGWAMFLDYLIIPVVNVIYGALTLARLMPWVPYWCWAALFAAAITLLNLRGVRIMARANDLLLATMSVVIVAFVVVAVRFVAAAQGWGGLVSFAPLYNPATFDAGSLMTATSLAALTYIGFDGVTTLAEEVKDPARTVPIATVLVCLLTGVFSAVEVYLAQLIWPDFTTFPNLETAFLDVTRRAGGEILFQAMGVILVVACLGSGLAGLAGAARLLYAMGRENVLPRRWFGRFDSRRNQPTANIVLVGVLALAGAIGISYERGAALLNFGAFLAFMGVNLAALRSFGLARNGRPAWRMALGVGAPALGFLFCAAIWWSLPLPAKLAGGVWFAVGVAQVIWKTRGFRQAPGDLFADSAGV